MRTDHRREPLHKAMGAQEEAGPYFFIEGVYWNSSEGLTVLIPHPLPKGVIGMGLVLYWALVKGGTRTADLELLSAHCVSLRFIAAPLGNRFRSEPRRNHGGGRRRISPRPTRPDRSCLPISGLDALRLPPWTAPRTRLPPPVAAPRVDRPRPKYPALTPLQLVAQRACILGKAATMAPLALTSSCLVGGCACNPG